MNKITRQSAFDIVWQKFVVEKSPKSVSEDSCVYNGLNGCSCAFGVLIPPELRPLLKERMDASENLETPEIAALFEDPNDNDFYDELQGAHDNSGCYSTDFTTEIKARLRQLADRFSLVIPTEATA